jgi:hypothetical protein
MPGRGKGSGKGATSHILYAFGWLSAFGKSFISFGKQSAGGILRLRLGAAMLWFRSWFEPQSMTRTSLLGDGHRGEAVLVDPVFEPVFRGTSFADVRTHTVSKAAGIGNDPASTGSPGRS